MMINWRAPLSKRLRATAPALTKAAVTKASAPAARSIAAVPLVVVMTTGAPGTRAGSISRGELPMSKPGGGSPPRSPAKSAPSSRAARRLASSTSLTGQTSRAPALSKEAIIVVARSTSMTTAIRPWTSSWVTSAARKATSIFTRDHLRRPMTSRAVAASKEERTNGPEATWRKPEA